jgi:hypothetical protein
MENIEIGSKRLRNVEEEKEDKEKKGSEPCVVVIDLSG